MTALSVARQTCVSIPLTVYSLRAIVGLRLRCDLVLLANMPLNELRAARNLTQEHLAELLHSKQASVSKMERRADMYIGTLAKFIVAMGGQLEIRAIFPGGDVRITQFSQDR